MKLNEFNDKDRSVIRCLVSECKKCVNNAGKPYLTVLLSDSSGSLDCRKWEVTEDDYVTLEKGNYVEVDLVANSFDKKLQGKILMATKLDILTADYDELIAKAPVEVKELHERLKKYIAGIKDEAVSELTKAVFAKYYKKYRDWPAAASNHHNYLHGLIYHSLTMADLASHLCDIYPVLNRDIVIAGTILHDIGKTIELSGFIATSYTLEGKLLGHLSIGANIIHECAKELGYFAYDDLSEEEKKDKSSVAFHKKEVAIVLEHILLSHHSLPEYGAAVRPLTRESQIVSMIDDIDAKMMILQKAYEGVEKGDFTNKIFSMDNRYFYKPMYTEKEDSPFGENE